MCLRLMKLRGDWRKLHNVELNDLYPSPNIVRVIKSRRMRWGVHVTRMGKRRSLYRILVRKPEGKTPLGRSMRDGKIILRLIFRKWDVGGMEWIELAQDRDSWQARVNAAMNFLVP